MTNSGKRTIIIQGDKDKEPKRIVLEDNGRPKKIVFEENGKAKRIILEGDDDPEHPRQTVVIRESGNGRSKPKKSTIVVIAMAAIPALVGAGVFGWYNRPRDPTMVIKDITLSGFSLHTSTESMLLATIDIDTTIYVMVRNPNITPICFHATLLEIFYRGSLLGQAMLHPGDMRAQSEQILALPCRMSGVEATHHLKDLFHDVTNREMTLHAKATVKGDIKVWKYRHHYEVYVRSEIKVDPFFLDVIDQRHRADIKIRGVAVPGLLDK
ncbi:hypothetical protein M758_10G082100 [Ceratodon purpureus]|uniref:Late embryogenesis abundant protein LEA-2 subgroup domain-containing protein n=1 Tax=Ceratodon purpureus TaxID=3225 RepID=A0A8T0GJI1_CERPU|nr:hypothetical protein KC19_10G083500 [Ceratodon purpureus]KAG0603295.1 hypothetical protein M758_10G082100 [Ceratodon purpureus]